MLWVLFFVENHANKILYEQNDDETFGGSEMQYADDGIHSLKAITAMGATNARSAKVNGNHGTAGEVSQRNSLERRNAYERVYLCLCVCATNAVYSFMKALNNVYLLYFLIIIFAK